jgi:hypothetical protein
MLLLLTGLHLLPKLFILFAELIMPVAKLLVLITCLLVEHS